MLIGWSHAHSIMITDSIFNAIVVRLESFQHIRQPFHEKLRPLLKIRKVAKGQLLLKAGNRANHLWFLYQGFAREIGHDEDVERTSWFYFSGDFLYSYPSFFSQLPAFRDIEVISDSTLVELSYRDLLVIRHEFDEVNIIFDQARDQCESERAKYASQTHTLSAKERYDDFYKSHKALFNVARHKDIASFLRIKSDGFRRYNQ